MLAFAAITPCRCRFRCRRCRCRCRHAAMPPYAAIAHYFADAIAMMLIASFLLFRHRRIISRHLAPRSLDAYTPRASIFSFDADADFAAFHFSLPISAMPLPFHYVSLRLMPLLFIFLSPPPLSAFAALIFTRLRIFAIILQHLPPLRCHAAAFADYAFSRFCYGYSRRR